MNCLILLKPERILRITSSSALFSAVPNDGPVLRLPEGAGGRALRVLTPGTLPCGGPTLRKRSKLGLGAVGVAALPLLPCCAVAGCSTSNTLLALLVAP